MKRLAFLPPLDAEARELGAVCRRSEPYTPSLPRDIFAHRYFRQDGMEIAYWLPTSPRGLYVLPEPREWGPEFENMLGKKVDIR